MQFMQFMQSFMQFMFVPGVDIRHPEAPPGPILTGKHPLRGYAGMDWGGWRGRAD